MTTRHGPEILAPAGDEEALRAAVGAGADAVYFGLQTGFNARMRMGNFAEDDLPRVFEFLHARGVKGYVTFNTVVYDSELQVAERALSKIAQAGADAIIVQDLGIARFAHALAPSLHLHASTQMTVSSPEGAAIAKELGITRVVLPRELNLEEIRRFKANTDLELETFVHGALCVSWSGQCLTSEAWGQRSANRGQCAQSCRLPYGLVVDGTEKSTVEEYLLSPKDLGAWDLLPDLAEAGVSCFKIEGRYKSAEYVAGAVEKYRKVRDAWLEGRRITLDRQDVEELSLTYSRGFSPGWLKGDDHQELSHGLFPGHRGLKVGVVEKVSGFSVFVRLDPMTPIVKAGDWMVFDQGDPEGDEPRGGTFSVEPAKNSVQELRFGDPGPDLKQVRVGNVVWKSHDSALKRRLLRYVEAERKVPIDLVVRGGAGRPLEVAATDHFGRAATVLGEIVLEPARNAALGTEVLREKLGAFGDTRYELRHLDVTLEGGLALPPSELKRIRRRLVEALELQPIPVQSHAVQPVDLGALAPRIESAPASAQEPQLVPLCRTLEQVDAVLAAGCGEVYLDFMELVGLGEAVKKCRAAGARVVIATMRVQKPGEEPFDKRFENLKPDGILARHLGALHHYRGRVGQTFALHGDFSLNATNVVTGRTLLSLGLATLTPSYDLNVSQLEDLAGGLPAERLEVTLHQHLPLYHTEYCVYAHNLSDGKDFRDCGRPCEEHRVALKDGKGVEHPVLVDVGCRNTVFNARAQSAAPHLKTMLGLGVRRFRVEFVWETADEVRQVLESYRALAAGKKSAAQVVRDVGAMERYGVTSGTFAVLGTPTAA